MIKYAIVNEEGEFYPDPIYTDSKKIEEKITYLENYRKDKNMKWVNYTAEILTPEREKQHEEEWKRFCSAID
jgi:ribonuclease HI